MSLQRLFVGPDRTAVRVGAPAALLVAALTAGTTAWILASQSGGGVYWPLDAALVGLVASAAYAARYRAAVVCLALGVAAFVGSQVGFHAVHGDEAVLGVLVRAVSEPELLAFGVVFGAVGWAAGAVVGYALSVRRRQRA